MKFSHVSWILFSGAVWLGIGVLLLKKGLDLIVLAVQESALAFSSSFGPEQVALGLIASGLLLGFLKGRFILRKTVDRITQHICSFPTPVAFKNVYTKSYYLLIGSMMAMGFALKWLPIYPELRGFIDVTIGSALINGSMLYFRRASLMRIEG